jgi:hypothetical protein
MEQIHSAVYELETPDGTARMELELPGEHPPEDAIKNTLHAWTVDVAEGDETEYVDCPECGHPVVVDCDCPECGWDGMCYEQKHEVVE